MSKVWVLNTVIMGHQGSGNGFSYCVKLFDDEAVAKRAREEHGSGVKSVVEQGKIIMPTPEGPKMAMTVAQFLGMLGIGNIAHQLSCGEVANSSLVVPSHAIIIPGQN